MTMGEARDIIAARIGKLMGWQGPLATSEADAFIAALTVAGWTLAPPGSRVVPDGGVDAVTVERCIAEIDCGCERDHCPSVDFCVKDDVAALRALAEAKP